MNEPLRDPTAETAPMRRARRGRLSTREGTTVALFDIGKMRGDEFLSRLEHLFTEAGVETTSYRKPTNTRVAPTELLQRVAMENQAVVLALSD